MMIGYNNTMAGGYGAILIGNYNDAAINYSDPGKEVLLGSYLQAVPGYLNEHIILGKYNTYQTTLSNTQIIIGSGDSNTRKNAIEINTTDCKIKHNLQLNADATAVNAITPPSDPSNPTTAEQTLATKAYIDAQLSAISSNLPLDILPSSVSLDENNTVLDLSSYWSNVRASDNFIRFYIRVNGSCYETTICNCLAVDGYLEFIRDFYNTTTNKIEFYSYSFHWDHTNKTLTLSDSYRYTIDTQGQIADVTHNLTGIVITIYRAETFK